MTMTERARSDRIATNHGNPLEFRTVMAISLDFLLNIIGIVDYIHCDIQGSEVDVFAHQQMQSMNVLVRRCCIATHGAAIEITLLKIFENEGWILECRIPGVFEETGGKDGAFVWANPRLHRPN